MQHPDLTLSSRPCVRWTQGRPDDLGAVVASLRSAFGLRHIYCWHGLSAYWSGVATDEPGMATYQARAAPAIPV